MCMIVSTVPVSQCKALGKWVLRGAVASPKFCQLRFYHPAITALAAARQLTMTIKGVLSPLRRLDMPLMVIVSWAARYALVTI